MISARARPSTFSSVLLSHLTRSSMIRNSRWRSRSCASSVGNSSGSEDGSSTSDAKSTARHAANGRLAHHKCSVDGCPCRIDFSRLDAALIASRGRATSMSFFFMVSSYMSKLLCIFNILSRQRILQGTRRSRDQLLKVEINADLVESRLPVEGPAHITRLGSLILGNFDDGQNIMVGLIKADHHLVATNCNSA